MTKSNADRVFEAWDRLEQRHVRIDGALAQDAWIDLDAPRAAADGGVVYVRGPSAVLHLRERIEFAERNQRGSTQLLAGFRGSGKTSVLLKLEEWLASQRYVVVPVDIQDFHSGAGPRTVETLLLTVAVAVGEFVADLQHVEARTLPAWVSLQERVISAVREAEVSFSSEIDLRWLKAQLRNGTSFHDQLAQVLGARRSDVFQSFAKFMAEVVVSLGGRPVFLIDGLEKLNALVDETAAAYRRFAEFFTQYGEVLSIADAHVIYVVPPQILVAAPQLQQSFHFAQLSCIRVAPRPPHGIDAVDVDGCAALEEVLAQRLRGLGELFEPAALRAIVRASGGHLRRLLAVASDVIMRASRGAGDVVQLPIPLARATRAIEEHGVLLRQAASFNAKALRAVKDAHAIAQLEPHYIDAMLVALDQELVLNYRNGDLWYDVHPLARPALED